MRLLRKAKDRFVFHLGPRDRPMLRAVLNRYPVVPSAHQPLSRYAPSRDGEINQSLLDEALAEQRQQNERQLHALLRNSRRFRKTGAGWQMTLSIADIEWLLQVLNDVRVGSWIILGSPEQDLWDFVPNDETMPHALAMEMAGYFQQRLLEAITGERDT